MNITRRSLLQAIGLGSAVAVTGVSVADSNSKLDGPVTITPPARKNGFTNQIAKEMLEGFEKKRIIFKGDTIKASDDRLYKAIGTS